MKAEFDSVVREHTGWLLALVRQSVKNPAIAEELTQEIWLRAWRSYDTYAECGRLRHWLARIARNVVNSYYHRAGRYEAPLSLDAENADGDPLSDIIADGDASPEDEILRREVTERVRQALARMPEKQRQLLVWRYFDGVTVAQAAARSGIPEGTVKSRTHYALESLKKRLGVEIIQKGESMMDCREARKYLFVYAKGSYHSDALEAHLADCAECRAMADAMKRLIPTMTFALDDEMSHFLIHFPKQHISYCGMSCQMENHAWMNEMLAKWKNKIPDEYCWLGGGFGVSSRLDALFDADGRELPFVTWKEGNGKYFRYKATEMYRIDPCMWEYSVYTTENDDEPRRSREAPNLYRGMLSNGLGSQAKSALYEAIPAGAENIRIRRGSGVIDCGTYSFAYADRYVTEDESVVLEYSFLLN